MTSSADMAELERIVRLYIYGQFLEHARPPTVEQTAEALHTTRDDVRVVLDKLASEHILVLEPDKRSIRMAMPFSAVPTAFEVRAIQFKWYANCAWDALGIPAMLNCDARITTKCPDCDEQLTLAVMDGDVVGHTEVVHFTVPAARWWENIVFT